VLSLMSPEAGGPEIGLPCGVTKVLLVCFEK
jgi:hypothetical protein